MDNFYLSAMVAEVRPLLVNQILEKVSLVNSQLLLDFNLASRFQLTARMEPSMSAFYLGPQPKEKPNEAHPFVAVLRKQLQKSKLTELSKPQFERIVRLDFETYSISGEKSRRAIIFSFTGRSSNIYLLNEFDRINAVLKLRSLQSIGDHFRIPEPPFDLQIISKKLSPAMTQEDFLNHEIINSAIFSPLMKREFLARCKTTTPTTAFQALLFDAIQSEPQPIIYSRLPLERVGKTPINIKTDLLLAHFPLHLAEGMRKERYTTLSQAANHYFQLRERAIKFHDHFAALTKLIAHELKKRESLLKALDNDRKKYQDPELFKRLGDLLLANLSTAQISGNKVKVIDLFDAGQPELDIEIGENKTLQQAANEYFSRFQKARRALGAITVREKNIGEEYQALSELSQQLQESQTTTRWSEIKMQVDNLLGIKPKVRPTPSQKQGLGKPVGKRYISPSGYEILVGRHDKDNELLTFRLAAPQDVWLHAADYPGSHVIIRNPSRKELPVRVIQEAAELAAFHSQAKKQKKVAVHYTLKKFVFKPPRSKPGLVRLSSFKTILVEPKDALPRIENLSY